MFFGADIDFRPIFSKTKYLYYFSGRFYEYTGHTGMVEQIFPAVSPSV